MGCALQQGLELEPSGGTSSPRAYERRSSGSSTTSPSTTSPSSRPTPAPSRLQLGLDGQRQLDQQVTEQQGVAENGLAPRGAARFRLGVLDIFILLGEYCSMDLDDTLIALADDTRRTILSGSPPARRASPRSPRRSASRSTPFEAHPAPRERGLVRRRVSARDHFLAQSPLLTTIHLSLLLILSPHILPSLTHTPLFLPHLSPLPHSSFLLHTPPPSPHSPNPSLPP
jgi:hypothetical protein